MRWLALVQTGDGDGDERDPWISTDGRTLYFTSDRNGIQEIFRATRTSPGEAFGAPERLANLTVSEKDQEHAALTADERTLVLASNRNAGGKFELFITQRPDTGTELGSPNQDHLAMVNVRNTNNRDPFLSSGGRTLYFTQDVDGPARARIVFATRLDTASDFGQPSELGGINRGGVDTADPALALDDRVIVFSTDRDGHEGSNDLWYATRGDANREFSAPSPIPMVNGGEDDADPMLSADGCQLYFASASDDDFQLYVSDVAH